MIRRKQIKRMAGCVMAVTMALTGVPVTAGTENINVEVVYADETLTYTEGNSTYTYTELSDGTLEISDYEGTDSEIVIPGEIDGKKVTSIGVYAFFKCSSLERVEIPEGVTGIASFVFSNCSSLISVEIPDSVTSIGDSAFEYCSSLESIEIPDSVTSIGELAFEYCSSLEEIEVDINNLNYKSVEGVLFNKEMTEIICYPSGKKDMVYIIPEGVTNIGDDTFLRCSSLTRIEIPEGVTSIGNSVFNGCSSLTRIEIPEGVTNIGDDTFLRCSSLTSVEIPESVTSIGDYVFWDCSKLTRIEIPESVTSIGYGAFYGCSSLTRIEIPEGVTSIASFAFSNCSSLISVEIPESVTSIGWYAFLGCSSLTSIEIPDSVTSIGDYAFAGCSSLEEIEVDTNNLNYKSVEGVLFNKEMTEIICYPSGKKDMVYIIPEGVTSINSYAFNSCRSLTSIEISSGVRDIAYSAFKGCSSLEEIEVDADNLNYKSVEGVLFDKELTKIICYPSGKKDTVYIIPKGVTSIGDYAFAGCSSLEEIEVDTNNLNYKSIEGILFNKEMTEIICYPSGKKDTVYVIPKEVMRICSSAFEGCSSLTSVEIPSSVTYIAYDAFESCSNLTIYGKKDSYAETYAKDNDIPFIAIDEITSSDNITVIYPVDSVQGTVSLQTKKLTEADEEYKKINLEDKIIDSAVSVEDVAFTAYDISLVDENNNKVQPSQVVTVKIPCPEGYDGEKCNIYRVNDDGTFTDMKAEYENGYFVFETSHFSIYVITETELVADEEEIIIVIKGDVNGDGTLDIKDSALLKRYLAGWEVEIDEEAADVDGDGKVTIKDSALVKRYLAGWDIEFVAD